MRTELAGFLSALLTVYLILVVGYCILTTVLSIGVRVPYSRAVDVLMNFLRDTAEPWLRLFRGLPLRVGPLDLTPIVAILVLQFAGRLIIGAIDPA